MNILFLYRIYIFKKSINISHYVFVCLVNFSNEKYIRVKKKKLLELFLRKNRYQIFVNYSRIPPIWQILFVFLFASYGIHKLFLFLFVQKLAPQIYSYSFLLEKLLIADHCSLSFCNKVFQFYVDCLLYTQLTYSLISDCGLWLLVGAIGALTFTDFVEWICPSTVLKQFIIMHHICSLLSVRFFFIYIFPLC